MRKKIRQKKIGIIITTILLLSNVFSFVPKSVLAANSDGSMTVAEAIANNTGTGTVEGYIVGHATGSLAANFLAPFSNDYNILIADSPNEHDKTKILDVQLSANYRAEFGLQTNPNNIGKKVKVTGALATYNSFPGLKSPTDIKFLDDSNPPGDQDVIPIAQARELNENDPAVITGTVTSISGAFGSKGVYVQDETGGIYVDQSQTDLVPGDIVKVTGTRTTYRSTGEVEISASNVEKTSTGSIPTPVVLKPSEVTSNYLGQLVRITGATVSNIQDVGTNGSFQFDANVGTDKISIYVDDRTTITKETVKEGDKINVRGVVAPNGTSLEIKPLGNGDISPSSADGSGLVDVQLLGINDLHGKLDQHYDLDINGDGKIDGTYGGAEYFATYIRQKQAEKPNNTLFLGVGDIIGGSSPVSALFQDEPTVEIMNSLGMSVNVVGNHEFDEGTGELLRMVNGGDYPGDNIDRPYSGMDNDELAANVVYKSGDHAGESILPAYSVKTVAGQKIGFIGVVTQSAAAMVMPSGIQDVEFTDPVTAINNAVAELHKQNIHAIVVLAHSAADQDSNGTINGEAADYAKKVDPDVDVIFAAHNHVIDNGTVNGKLIVQAYEYGKAFSDVDLTIDPATGDIVSKNAQVIYVDDSKVTPDPAVSQILKKYADEAGPLLNEVVGKAAIDMTGGYGVKGEKGDNAVGNLIADSMRAAMKSDFAMVNGGGIRDNLGQGDITYNDLFNILPFNNILETLEIKGSDLVNIVNAQLSTYYGPDFSISGFRYTWDGNTGKVMDIFLPDGKTKIDPSKTYTLTVNNFMATATAAKYKAIGDAGKNPVTGPEDLEALVDFVKSFNGEPIHYVPEGRMSEVTSIPTNPPTDDVISIADATAKADGTSVTLEGVVTSTPGEFGSSKSFYLQDDTGAANVYVYADPGFKIGDKVKITTKKSTYNGEVEFNNITASTIEGHVELSPRVVSSLSSDLLYQLVSLHNVKVTNLTSPDQYGSFSFDAVDGNNTTTVYIDNRTGITYDSWSKQFHEGDMVDLAGIVVKNGSGYELKPRSLDDFSINVSDSGTINVTDDQIAQIKKKGNLEIQLNENTNEQWNVVLSARQVSSLLTQNATLTVKNSAFTLEIPIKNLKPGQGASLNIKKRSDLVNSNIVSSVFDYTLSQGTTTISKFTKPITLTFNLDNKVSKHDHVKIYYYNEAAKKWEIIGSHYSNGEVTATISHFSTYAVLEKHSK